MAVSTAMSILSDQKEIEQVVKPDSEVCIVVAGQVDSGKSSLLGVLTSGELDDGKGSARAKICKHPHELELGQTSDISTKIMRFGNIDESGTKKVTELTMVDLCGHQKYFKTTLTGILGYFPDYAIVVIGANRGVQDMTKEHMLVLLHLRIPFVVIITRIDIAPRDIYLETVDTVRKLLVKVKRNVVQINTMDDLKIEDPSKLIEQERQYMEKIERETINMRDNPYIVPIISVSNKTGHSINVVRYMLTTLQPRDKFLEEIKGSIFYIDSKFTPKGIGLVVSGLVRGNVIKQGQELLIGPIESTFCPIRAWSLHNNNRQKVESIGNNQRGCLAIRSTDKSREITKLQIRKGMIITTKESIDQICYQFTADVCILHHPTMISNRYTPTIQCGNIRQTARIILSDDQKLKTKDRASVSFRFIKYPEYLEPGMRLFFREGKTRGTGIVTSILPLKNDPNKKPAELNKWGNKFKRHRQKNKKK